MVERGLIDKRCLVEKLLVYEVEAWEALVWNGVKEFTARNDMPESGKEQLTWEWRGNCWKRLEANIRAMDERMEDVKEALSGNEVQHRKLGEVHDESRDAWQSVIELMVDTPTPSASSTPGYRFNEDVQELEHASQQIESDMEQVEKEQNRRWHTEMTCQLKKELADVEFRMAQGLDRCDQFFQDDLLGEWRHSRSKLLTLDIIVLFR